MAFLFLRAQGAPGLVSSIVINAAAGRAVSVENATLSDLAASPHAVEFSASEAALPFPVDADAAPALALVPFTAELNRQLLRVTGLGSGSYRLLIDDQPVGEFSDESLAAGVNLATLADTPQMRQARAVRAALGRKWDAVGKLRAIAYSEHFAWPDAPRPYDTAAMIARVEARIRSVGASNPWIVAQHRLFLDLKPRETDWSAEAASALAEARSLAQPRAHRFKLVALSADDAAPSSP